MTRTHVLATVLVICALAAPAAPAAAKEITVKDARGDVWREADTVNATPAPSIRSGDITKAVIAHRGKHAAVRIVFKRLARKGAYTQVAVRLQGSKGRIVREVLVESSRRDRNGVVRVFNANGRPAAHCDADHDIDFRRDRVSLSLDRRCLHKPGRIRANVNTARATGSGIFYSDNVHDTAAESVAWSEWVKRTR